MIETIEETLTVTITLKSKNSNQKVILNSSLRDKNVDWDLKKVTFLVRFLAYIPCSPRNRSKCWETSNWNVLKMLWKRLWNWLSWQWPWKAVSTTVQNVKLGNGLTFRVNLKLDFVSNWNNEIIYFAPYRKKTRSRVDHSVKTRIAR